MLSRPAQVVLTAFAGVLLAACGGGGSQPPDVTPAAQRASVRMSAPLWPDQAALAVRPQRSPAMGAADAGWQFDISDRTAAQFFYRTLYASSDAIPIAWTGDIGRCDAGDTPAALKDGMARRINWMRAMAGVPAAVTLDANYNRQAQQAALIMAANGQLSHAPPSNWTCWSAEGSQAAGKSNLTQSAGPAAVDNYMEEFGANNAAVGHRRWLLYPQTRFMGSGDVSQVQNGRSVQANALWVFDDNLRSTRPAVRSEFVAWPPAGHVPHTTVYARWSFSYPDADFSQASVGMTEDGKALATLAEPLSPGYGENTLVWFPGSYRDGMRWARPSADKRYEVDLRNVRINGLLRDFRYVVTVFDAEAPPPWGAAQSVSGNTSAQAGQNASYRFQPVSGATGYQWRASALAPLSLFEGAEQGASAIVLNTSAGYDPLAAGVAASGSRSVHLAHALPVDQSMALRTTVVPQTTSTLRFASRLGFATSAQTALVEVSADEGRSWTTLFRQSGDGTRGEIAFVSRQLPLAPWAGRTVLLRFRYAFEQGQYFTQTSDGVGWYVDDIQVQGASTLVAAGAPEPANGLALSLALPSSGSWLVQARPGAFGHWADWSSGLVVAATAPPTRTDCLLNWAERRFPELLTPPAASQISAPFRYRAYAGEVYVGVSSINGHVYYLHDGRLEDLGAQEPLLAQAGC